MTHIRTNIHFYHFFSHILAWLAKDRYGWCIYAPVYLLGFDHGTFVVLIKSISKYSILLFTVVSQENFFLEWSVKSKYASGSIRVILNPDNNFMVLGGGLLAVSFETQYTGEIT